MAKSTRTKPVAAPQKASQAAPHTKIELKDLLGKIQARHDLVASTAPQSMGACLRIDPETAQMTCTFTDQISCQNLGGTFVGGPCGG